MMSLSSKMYKFLAKQLRMLTKYTTVSNDVRIYAGINTRNLKGTGELLWGKGIDKDQARGVIGSNWYSRGPFGVSNGVWGHMLFCR